MRLVLALCGVALVAGCSSTPMRTAESTFVDKCDYAQMDRVERADKKTLTEVHWVNCPQLRDTAKSS